MGQLTFIRIIRVITSFSNIVGQLGTWTWQDNEPTLSQHMKEPLKKTKDEEKKTTIMLV